MGTAGEDPSAVVGSRRRHLRAVRVNSPSSDAVLPSRRCAALGCGTRSSKGCAVLRRWCLCLWVWEALRGTEMHCSYSRGSGWY
eukprot:1711673-Rhodomonas_salina.6